MTKATMWNWLAAGLLAVAGALAGCEALPIDDADAGAEGEGEGDQSPFGWLYGSYFQECQHCHTPDGLGRTDDTEQTLNFTSLATTHTTLTTGAASGLTGNQEGCNGVPFVAATPAASLVLAVLDEQTRQAFDVPAHTGCDNTSISDMTVKAGGQPSSDFIRHLTDWIEDGAPEG